MRLEEIVSMLQRNFMLGLSLTGVVALLFYVGYRVVYLKKVRGARRLSGWQLSVLFAFLLYVVTVCALTLLSRGSNYEGSVNLALFSSYREAWYHASVRGWQYIYFNIAMFVPLGLLLPLIAKRFERLGFVLLAAVLFTGFIEVVQYITGVGIFELDDLFNNVLGAVIGYGLIQAVRTRRIVYLLPIALVVGLSIAMFSYYEQQEFGNLSIGPAVKVEMKDIQVVSDVVLSDKETIAAVYKAPRLTSEEGEQFAYKFFERMGLDLSANFETIEYQHEANYRYHGEPAYFIWLDFLDRSFELTDFSSFEVAMAETNEAHLKQLLAELEVNVPEQATFERLDVGRYKWRADGIVSGAQLIDGVLAVDYFVDDTLKSIRQSIVTYDKVRDVQLKSEQAAYEELLSGRFELYATDVRKLHIQAVELDYILDSKGFYQPVYAFDVLVDGEATQIFVPALK